MLLRGVRGELFGGVANDPSIDMQAASVRVDRHNVGSLDGVVPVRVGSSDEVTLADAKHAVASHLDVKGVFLSIKEGLGKNPLHSLAAASEALERLAVLGPDQTLVVGVPVKLDQLLIANIVRDCDLDPEPMSGPGWTKAGADLGLFKVMRDGLFEGWPGLSRSVPNPELDMRLAVDDGIVHHGKEVFVGILAPGVELADARLVDLADVLADWFGSPDGIVTSRTIPAVVFAAHGERRRGWNFV